MAAAAVALASPIPALLMIFRFGVDVPVEDQIDIGAFLVRNHERLFPLLTDLFAQHNESRKVIPRLIVFYLAHLTQWNVKYEMAAQVAMACGTVAAIWIVARRLLGDVAPPATALCALLVLSPVQWWNFLFGIQIVVFIPMLMLAAALAVAGGERALPWRVMVAASCCAIATYSYANGMLLWFLVAIALFSRPGDRRLPMIFLWAVTTAVTIGTYFLGYHRPPVSPLLISPLQRPMDAARFVLAFLGHSLAWSDALSVSVTIGALGVVVFGVLAWRERRAWPAALPWFLIGTYSLVSAGAAATGRLGFGEQAAIEPRYTTFAAGFWVAIVMLAAMALPRGRTLGAAVLLILHVSAAIAVIPKIRESNRDRLVARTAMQFVTVLPDTSLFRRLIYRDPQHAIPIIASLARIGYIHPPPTGSPIVRSSGVTRGALEGVLRGGPQRWLLYGWALLPDGRAADAVLITRQDRLVAISERTIGRPDRPGPGWDLPLTPQLAVPGTVLTALAYDTSTRRAYRLSGVLRIGNP